MDIKITPALHSIQRYIVAGTLMFGFVTLVIGGWAATSELSGAVISQGGFARVDLDGGVLGANFNGFTTPGGWTMPTDLDGDGIDDDPVGAYSPNPGDRLWIDGPVGGDLVTDGLRDLRTGDVGDGLNLLFGGDPGDRMSMQAGRVGDTRCRQAQPRDHSRFRFNGADGQKQTPDGH